jgi:hypothetical protein
MPRLILYTCDDGLALYRNGIDFCAWNTESVAHHNRFSIDGNEVITVDDDMFRIPANASSIVFSENNNNNSNRSGKNMEKEKFYAEKLQKAGMTLKGIASLVTQSFEVESMTKKDEDDIRIALNRINGGCGSSKQENNGNGWNRDSHHDCSLTSYSRENGGLFGTETSASPIDIVSYSNIKSYLDGILATYKQATGGVYHTYCGSTHVHNTVAYIKDQFEVTSSIELDASKIYNNVARFFLKFMPVMKWLVMTDKLGARGVRGSSYDLLQSDELFDWWGMYQGSLERNSMSFLKNMQRSSYLRILGNAGQIHFENRMCDTTFNSTHLAMWLSVNKAITLFAIDFARKDYLLPLSNRDIINTKTMMSEHENGYKHVNREKLESLYKEFVSYLVKYLKITGSLDCIEVMDKLIKCPISQWIDENGYDMFWNTDLIEKVFNTRNRASDTQLREKFMSAIELLEVKSADSLNEFLENMASHLEVEVKKVKSLYQMFKRENIDIEFLGGRLVYLGD